jgi:hypothetical protein
MSLQHCFRFGLSLAGRIRVWRLSLVGALFLLLGTLCGPLRSINAPLVAWASEADPSPNSLHKEPTFVSRAVVSVGSDVYTDKEADLILALWNTLGEPVVERTTDFRRFDGLRVKGPLSGFDKLLDYPADVRRLMFILLVWTEARRLNLFVSGDKSLGDARGVLDASGFPERGFASITPFWSQMGESDQLLYIDMVLRGRAYLRIRGDLEANRRLAESTWYWHTLLQK